MPNLTKAQLKEIAKKYKEFDHNHFFEHIDLGELFKRNLMSKYIDTENTPENFDTVVEGFALGLAAYKLKYLEQIDVENLCNAFKFTTTQFFTVADMIDHPVLSHTIIDGKVDIDPSGIELNFESEFKDFFHSPNYSNDVSRDSIMQKVNEEHQKMLKEKKEEFNFAFFRGDKKVLLDRDFFESLINTRNYNYPSNKNSEEDPLYKTVQNNMDNLNTVESYRNKKVSYQIAIDKFKNFTALSNSFNQKSFIDFLSGPINFIKEWWTLRNVKNSIKEEYSLNDKAIDSIQSIANKGSLDDKFQILEENGNIITSDPTKEEIYNVTQKMMKNYKSKVAQDKILKIQEEFAPNFKQQEKTTKKEKSVGIQFADPSKDDLLNY